MLGIQRMKQYMELFQTRPDEFHEKYYVAYFDSSGFEHLSNVFQNVIVDPCNLFFEALIPLNITSHTVLTSLILKRIGGEMIHVFKLEGVVLTNGDRMEATVSFKLEGYDSCM